MTRRTARQLVWVGIALCVVALALGVTWRFLGLTPGVTDANFRRVRSGMTVAEVETILGPHPGLGRPLQVGEVISGLLWRGEQVEGFVWLGDDGRATHASWHDREGRVSYSTPGGKSPLAPLRALFGW